MHDVFISYAREDRRRIRRLVGVLVEERGWAIWFDEELRAGEQFPRVIQQALEQARCVLVVWSRRSVESRWVIAEASEGWNRGVLVPVRLDDSEPPLPFRQTEATDLGEGGRPARAAVVEIIEAIDRALQRGSAPDRAELLAREARRRAHRRQKLARRVVPAIAVAALVAVGGMGWRRAESRAATDAMADRAAQLQAEVRTLDKDERSRTWGSVLFQSRERLDRLELATLVAVEALRRARTNRTQRVLEDLLAMSPWSDQGIELQNETYALRLSADGTKVVASGGVDGTIVWSPRSGVTIRIDHGGTGGRVSWEDRRGRLGWRGGSTADLDVAGARVATAGPDEAAVVWDAASGRELLRLRHESIVTSLAFVPRSDTLATVSESGIVRVWDLASGRELRRLEQGGTSYWLAVSESGHLVVSTSGRVARVWDPAAGIEVARLEHPGPVEAARFGPDESLLATFGSEIETTIWELPGGRVRKRIPVSAGQRGGVLFGPDGRTLIVGSTDGKVRWWSLDADGEQRSATVGQYVVEMAQSASRERFVTQGTDAVASAWEVASGRELRQMPYYAWLRAVAIGPDGRFMASSGFDGQNYVLEVTEIRPDDPVAAACRKVHRNLTREEWRQYVGESEPYRPSCPQVAQ